MVFISYAREDLGAADKLYQHLKSCGVEAWMDVYDLVPGQKWKPTIENVVATCSHVVLLLSANSVSKVGFVQKEIKLALDELDEHPESHIFLIPVRLDACSPSHSKLRDLHWVDMFPSWEGGMVKIMAALERHTDGRRLPHKYGDLLFGLGNHVAMIGWVTITEDNEVEMLNVFNRTLTIVETLGLSAVAGKVITEFLQNKKAMDGSGDVTKSAERMVHIRNLLSINIKSKYDVTSERIFSLGFVLTNVIYMCERPQIVAASKDYIGENIRHLRKEAVSLQLPHQLLDDALGILEKSKSRKERLLLCSELVKSLNVFEGCLR